MDNNARYLKDRATVMSTVKYILFAAIIGCCLFFATKLVVILLPFLIGFVLAKASRIIADVFLWIPNHFRKKKMLKNDKHEYIPAPKTKKPNVVVRFFFPAMGEKKYSQRTRVTILVYVLLLILVFVGTFWAVGAIIMQVTNAVEYLKALSDKMAASNTSLSDLASSAIENMLSYLSSFLDASTIESIRENCLSFVEGFGTKLFTYAESFAGSLISMLGSIPLAIFYVIAVIMSGYYFITDGRSLMRFFANNIKSRRFRMRTLRLLDQLSFTLFRVLGGYMVLLIVTFVESWIVFKLAGITYAAIFAFVTAFLDFLPVLGISATMIPMMVYVTAQGDIQALVVLIVGMALMTIIRRIIEPKILGKSLNMHPLATILGMIIGVYIWGVLGFLMGPVVLIIVIQSMKVFSIDKKLRSLIERLLNRLGEDDDEEDKKNNGKIAKKSDKKKDSDKASKKDPETDSSEEKDSEEDNAEEDIEEDEDTDTESDEEQDHPEDEEEPFYEE